MTAIISTLLAGNIGVQLVKAQQPPQEAPIVSAREFRLVNDHNQAMATMFVGEDGSPQFALFDANSTKRLELSVGGDTLPRIVLFDSHKKTRLKITQIGYRQYKGDPSDPLIELYSSQEKVLGSLGVNVNSKAELVFSGDAGGTMALKPDSLFFYSDNPQTTLLPGATTALFPYNGKSPALAFSKGGRFVWTAPPQQEKGRK